MRQERSPLVRVWQVLVISDWRNTGGVGATAKGPVDAGLQLSRNPHLLEPPHEGEPAAS
jgi:hypothetical protein